MRIACAVLAVGAIGNSGCDAGPPGENATIAKERLVAFLDADGLDFDMTREMRDVGTAQQFVGVFEQPDRVEYWVDGIRLRAIGDNLYEYDDSDGWRLVGETGETEFGFRAFFQPFLDVKWTATADGARARTGGGAISVVARQESLAIEIVMGNTSYTIRLSRMNRGQSVAEPEVVI